MEKATHQRTREHNYRLVLKTIYGSESISRADIARQTSLTRATVSDIVAHMLDEGLVVETGLGESKGGKPPINVSLLNQARQIIVVDLSGTEVVGALVDLRGNFIFRQILPVNHEAGLGTLEVVYTLLDKLISCASAPLMGISVGTPGLVDSPRGFIYLAVNLNWRDLNLGTLLEERYHLPIYISNDSHAAVLAEYTYGRWRGEPNQVLVKVGEGIGAGIVLNGKVYYGAGSMAGEIGHLSMVENGERCNCGNMGCLETVASIPAILQRAQRLASSRPQSFLNQRLASSGEITIADMQVGLENHDPLVEQIVVYTGEYLGRAVAEMVSVLNATRIVMCGDILRFGSPFLKIIQTELKKRVLPVLMEHVEIDFSTLGLDNVMLGCSAVVLSDQLGLP